MFFFPDTMCLQHGWKTRGVLCILPLETRVSPHNVLQCLGIVGICQGCFCEDCSLALFGKYLLTWHANRSSQRTFFLMNFSHRLRIEKGVEAVRCSGGTWEKGRKAVLIEKSWTSKVVPLLFYLIFLKNKGTSPTGKRELYKLLIDLKRTDCPEI